MQNATIVNDVPRKILTPNGTQATPPQRPQMDMHNGPRRHAGGEIKVQQGQTEEDIKKQLIEATENKLAEKGVYDRVNNITKNINSSNTYSDSIRQANDAMHKSSLEHSKDDFMRTNVDNTMRKADADINKETLFTSNSTKKVNEFGFDEDDIANDKTVRKKTSYSKATPNKNNTTKDNGTFLFEHNFESENKKTAKTNKKNVDKNIDKDAAYSDGGKIILTQKNCDVSSLLQKNAHNIIDDIGNKLGLSDSKEQLIFISHSEPSDNGENKLSIYFSPSISQKEAPCVIESVKEELSLNGYDLNDFNFSNNIPLNIKEFESVKTSLSNETLGLDIASEMANYRAMINDELKHAEEVMSQGYGDDGYNSDGFDSTGHSKDGDYNPMYDEAYTDQGMEF